MHCGSRPDVKEASLGIYEGIFWRYSRSRNSWHPLDCSRQESKAKMGQVVKDPGGVTGEMCVMT